MAEDRFSKEAYKLAELAIKMDRLGIEEAVVCAIAFLEEAERALAEGEFDGKS